MRLVLFGALVVIVSFAGVAAVNLLPGARGVAADEVISAWGRPLVFVLAALMVAGRAALVTERKGAWCALALGLLIYGVSNTARTSSDDVPGAPSLTTLDGGLWLGTYPMFSIGLMLLARDRRADAPRTIWLDALVAGLGFAAMGAAFVIGPLAGSDHGGTLSVATLLTYPMCDVLLIALVLGLSAHQGWHLDRVWSLLSLGFIAIYVADSISLLEIAEGDTRTSGAATLFYLSGVALLATAAWQPESPSEAPGQGRWSVLLGPSTFVATSIGLLLYDHFSPLTLSAVLLAGVTLIAGATRAAFTFHDVRTLSVTRVQAVTDELTSLPNRRLFIATLTETIAAAASGGHPASVLLIDIDQFKQLNDTLGHRAGDLLLRQVGPRILDALRENDLLARLGGDEFGVVLASPCDADVAGKVAERIGACFNQPFEIENLQLRVAASVGIALYPLHARDAEQLLSRADVAMYQAKRDRAGYALYASSRDGNSRDNLTLASELPSAISSDQIEVHFQPKADAVTGRVIGMEALARWSHPHRGLLPPGAFIGLAEQAGMMRELTRAVIGAALTACRDWHDAGHPIGVAVNVTFTDLMDATFPTEVANALAHRGLKPSHLTLEVTESSIMSDAEQIADVLTQLTETGVRISLDDFGTGYSSLSHLRTLPVSEIKIDRSFVARMRSDDVDEAIVRSTIQLAHNLGTHVVAEGVEDDATWTALTRLGCDAAQGYFISRPLRPAAALAYLAARPSQRMRRPSSQQHMDAVRTSLPIALTDGCRAVEACGPGVPLPSITSAPAARGGSR